MPDVESIHECQFNESVVFCGNFTDAIGMYELGLGNILKKRGLTRMGWRKIEGGKKNRGCDPQKTRDMFIKNQ